MGKIEREREREWGRGRVREGRDIKHGNRDRNRRDIEGTEPKYNLHMSTNLSNNNYAIVIIQ